MIRILAPGDEAALENFLLQHADMSMFLRANSRSAGLADRGQPLQATYAAAFEGADIVAVAAHCWNGILLLQAPVRAREVASAALAASGRALKGYAGPTGQLRSAGATNIEGETLFALQLNALRVPPLLAKVTCRRPREEELPLCVEWRRQYLLETGLSGDSQTDVALWHKRGAAWVLESGGALVAFSGFNARLPDMVQVGGVWTPPDLRGRGYARCAVAGSLLEVRSQGVQRAVLFTNNPAAIRAYQALGFAAVGEYGLALV